MPSSAIETATSRPPTPPHSPTSGRPMAVVITPPWQGQKKQTSPSSTVSGSDDDLLRRNFSLSPTGKSSDSSSDNRDNHHLGCSFSRQWLIHVAQETLDIADVGHYINQHGERVDISKDLKYSMEHSIHYHSSHEFNGGGKTCGPKKHTKNEIHQEGSSNHGGGAGSRRRLFDTTEFHVCWGSSLQVAERLQEELLKRMKKKNYEDEDEDTTTTTTTCCARADDNDNINPQSPSDSSYFEIGILNSASGKNPDKFLRGTLSQEEGICRASLLYPCLAQYKDRPHHFYYINHKPKYHESSSSCAIYCPRVPIIRQDDSVGCVLDTPRFCSIVNIPAPNAFVLGGESSLSSSTRSDYCCEADKEVDEQQPAVIPTAQTPGADERNESYDHVTIDVAMYDRIYRAISILSENGCTDLVLCAFGCGVHGNNPHKIAAAFYKCLNSEEFHGKFRIVAFAIQPSRQSNYDAFTKVFLKK